MKQIIVDNKVTSYFIDEEGNCYNSKTGKYLKGQISNSGYLNYSLSITPDYKKRLYSHRLVAQAYIPNPFGYKQVNHIDGDKLNNNVHNLEWCTSQQNIDHAIKTGLTNNGKTVYVFNSNRKIIHIFDSVVKTSEKLRICTSCILQEVNKQTKSLVRKKYYFSYRDYIDEKDIVIMVNTGKAKVTYKLDKEGNILGKYGSTGEAARVNFPELKKANSHIAECCRGKIKSYKGFIWKYEEDIV